MNQYISPSLSQVFLIWPLILSHRITADSPLWTLRPEDVYREKVDIIVILEGIIESTGELCQARTCYSARDILWGHRFVRVEEFDEIENVWCVDFTRFNNVLPSPTPRCITIFFFKQARTHAQKSPIHTHIHTQNKTQERPHETFIQHSLHVSVSVDVCDCDCDCV